MVLTFVSASTAHDDKESVDDEDNLSDIEQAKTDDIFSEAEEEYNSDITPTELQDLDITPTELQDLKADAIMPPKSSRKKSVSSKKSDDNGVSALVTRTSQLTVQAACYSPSFQFPYTIYAFKDENLPVRHMWVECLILNMPNNSYVR